MEGIGENPVEMGDETTPEAEEVALREETVTPTPEEETVSKDIASACKKVLIEKTSRGVVLKFNEYDELAVDEVTNEKLSKFAFNLPEKEPRYAVFRLTHTNRAGLEQEYHTFLYWMPDESPVKQRRQYYHNKAIVREKFDSIVLDITAAMPSDLSEERLKRRIGVAMT
ncbi:MAG: cofilin family protein [Candidatus Wukongarchaeota archaeon]|nr:cofilin family protein [Candidatus Wukongarchaeota archaeon]